VTRLHQIPRSQRGRYRARARAFAFIYRDGKVREEESGIDLPLRLPHYVVGRGPLPGDPDESYYFDESGGRSPETEARLHKEMAAHLFVLDGRLRSDGSTALACRTEKDWNKLLSDLDLGVDAGLPPWQRRNRSIRVKQEVQNNDEEPQDWAEKARQDQWDGASMPPLQSAQSRIRRPLVEVPRSDWERVLVARLAVIFNRSPEDALIQRMAAMLSNVDDWGKWGTDRALQPLRDELGLESREWALVERLELIAFHRYAAAYPGMVRKQPLRVTVQNELGTFTFSFPRWPQKAAQRSRAGRRAFMASRRRFIKAGFTTDPRVWAAVVWKAGPFLVEPAELRQHKLTLQRVARHFGLTPRKVRYAAQQLLKDPLPALPPSSPRTSA